MPRARQDILADRATAPAIPEAGEGEIGEPLAAVRRCGCLLPLSPVYSYIPLAGMMQRCPLKASRNIDLSAPDSARALNVAGTSLSDFAHQAGIRPQRIGQLALSVFVEPDHVLRDEVVDRLHRV
jgi:hypothetical protein